MVFLGSGKSTWIRNKYDYDRIFTHKTHILSSDNLRQELYNDINDQTHNEEVFTILKQRAVNYLMNGHRVVIDATNITKKSRKSITDYVEQEIGGFYEYGLIRYVIIATPYYKCLENNRKRDRQVPEEVIERMYKNFEFPTYMESVHKIEIVYPFGVNKDTYGIKHPYERLLKFQHDTPYHRLTVGEHLKETYETMKKLSNDRVLLKVAELHDIGKPFCKELTTEVNGVVRASYLNHANVGAYESMFYAKSDKFTNEEIVELCILVQYHMRLYDCTNDKSLLKLKNTVGEKCYLKLQMLNILDKEAH